MTKQNLAEAIENHHLYEPLANGVYSKNYYRYSSFQEINLLMKKTKQELQDIYNMLYDAYGEEYQLHEINA